MKCDHIDPATWDRVRGTDGHTRAHCPACKKFMGYVHKEQQPAKPKPEKGK